MANEGRAYAARSCPYCSVQLDPLPKSEQACPSCGQDVFVRAGPDGLRRLLRDIDLPASEEAWAEATVPRDDHDPADGVQDHILGRLAATSGLGLLVVSVADFRARLGLDLSEPLFWIGLAILVLPTAVALWSPRPTRAQRIGAVILLSLALYGVRVCYSPGIFVFFDEFSHWRTAIDIASTGTLFSVNPLQPVSPEYPGLQSFTVMFASLAGLGFSQAALVVIGAARIVVLVALYLFFERASGSSRVAGLGALTYTGNQSFLFFDAQFGYESFALALAATALVALAARSQETRSTSRRLTFVALLAIAATVVTHHMTSYGLGAFLVLWVLVWRLHRRPARTEAPPVVAAVFAVAATGAWLFLVAPQTIAYLAPHLQDGLQQLVQILEGQARARALFTDQTGLQAPLAERAVTYLAVILTLAGLPAGLWTILRLGRARPLALSLGLAALVYPATLVLRLTTEGAETGARLSAFAFVGVAFVIASWGASVGIPRISAFPRILLAGASLIMCAGGVIVGIPPWNRLPYPYRPAADQRSLSDTESIDAAQWTQDHLGPHQAFVSDRTNRQLLGTYGDQDLAAEGPSAQILLSTQSVEPRQLIAQMHIDYVLVDRRLSTAVPLVPGYVWVGENGGVPYAAPLDPAALAKFDTMSGSSRVFDSGDVQIFDVRDIR
jgi:hypothetical protein